MKYVRYKGKEFPYNSTIAMLHHGVQELKREKIYKVVEIIDDGSKKFYRLSGLVGKYPVELFDTFI